MPQTPMNMVRIINPDAACAGVAPTPRKPCTTMANELEKPTNAAKQPAANAEIDASFIVVFIGGFYKLYNLPGYKLYKTRFSILVSTRLLGGVSALLSVGDGIESNGCSRSTREGKKQLFILLT